MLFGYSRYKDVSGSTYVVTTGYEEEGKLWMGFILDFIAISMGNLSCPQRWLAPIIGLPSSVTSISPWVVVKNVNSDVLMRKVRN